jgi:hypothetical protein
MLHLIGAIPGHVCFEKDGKIFELFNVSDCYLLCTHLKSPVLLCPALHKVALLLPG